MHWEQDNLKEQHPQKRTPILLAKNTKENCKIHWDGPSTVAPYLIDTEIPKWYPTSVADGHRRAEDQSYSQWLDALQPYLCPQGEGTSQSKTVLGPPWHCIRIRSERRPLIPDVVVGADLECEPALVISCQVQHHGDHWALHVVVQINHLFPVT